MKTHSCFLLTDDGHLQYWVAEEDGLLGIGLNAFQAQEDLKHKQFSCGVCGAGEGEDCKGKKH